MTLAPASFLGNNRKIEPKGLPTFSIPCLLIAYTQQLYILVSTVGVWFFQHQKLSSKDLFVQSKRFLT